MLLCLEQVTHKDTPPEAGTSNTTLTSQTTNAGSHDEPTTSVNIYMPDTGTSKTSTSDTMSAGSHDEPTTSVTPGNHTMSLKGIQWAVGMMELLLAHQQRRQLATMLNHLETLIPPRNFESVK